MIMQSIDHCEGNVLQLITLRQLIIVQLDIEYDMQLFYNFFRYFSVTTTQNRTQTNYFKQYDL